MLSSKIRRAVAGCSLVLASSLVVGAPFATSTAGAEPIIPVKAKIKARVDIEKLNRDIKGLKSKFKGTLDVGTGQLKGIINIPPSTVAFPSNDANIAEIEVEIGKTKVKGHVKLDKEKVRTKSKFNIHVKSVTVLGLPPNLVGDECKTATPIQLTQKGPFSATEPAEMTGVFEIPPFENCQAFTAILTNLVSGPNNTFTAKFIPIN